MPEPTPLPPEILVDALQDRVHEEKGKLLKAEPIRRPPMPDEPMFLLSDEKIVKVHREKVRGFATMSEYGLAIVQAQLKKVGVYLRDNYYASDRAVYFSPVAWDALMREAGLAEKEAPDAKA